MKSDQFRSALYMHLSQATGRGAPHIDINSGRLHRQVGGYPEAGHRMPVCCQVMYAEMREGDRVLCAPPKGRGATLTIRYLLPRDPSRNRLRPEDRVVTMPERANEWLRRRPPGD